jgi:hypothetical protein
MAVACVTVRKRDNGKTKPTAEYRLQYLLRSPRKHQGDKALSSDREMTLYAMKPAELRNIAVGLQSGAVELRHRRLVQSGNIRSGE